MIPTRARGMATVGASLLSLVLLTACCSAASTEGEEVPDAPTTESAGTDRDHAKAPSLLESVVDGMSYAISNDARSVI